jgi:hypothetical protein
MALPTYQFSGAVYAAPTVGSTTFNLTTGGGQPIGFLDPAHIKVFTSLDGGASLVERFRPAQWDFNTARTQVVLAVGTVAGESVVLRRITPLTGPFVDVPDGINLPAERLRDLNLYNLYVTQEQYEANQAALAEAQAANLAVGVALSTIANQLPYVRYANRAAVPVNPGSAISAEVLDSTNMQTFTPLVGVPVGFVGSPSLIVRIRYNVALVRWEWIDYRPADADARYLLKTQLVNSVSSSSIVDPPTANAVRIAREAAATAQAAADAADAVADAASVAANAATVAAAAAAPLANPQFTGDPRVPQLNGGALAGQRNRIINGSFAVDQRFLGASFPLVAGAALAYTADRFYAFCTGAAVNGQRITVAGTQTDPNRLQFSGAASVTGIGIGQRIEAINCRDLAGRRVTLSVSLANTFLTNVAWQLFHANTNDTFGTLVAPTRTLIGSGNFTVNSTYTRYSASVDVPAAATTGLELVLTVGAQTGGTWTIGQVQLEPGDRVTPFEQRSPALEALLCQRYFQWIPYNHRVNSSGVGAVYAHAVRYPEMRANPSVGGIVADPNTTQSILNFNTGSVSNVTPYGCVSQFVANAVGDCLAFGYRVSANAEL